MSDQNQSAQDKTHEASPRKLERARKKGELARSQDAQTLAAYLGISTAILLIGSWSATYLGETLAAFLARPAELAAMFRGTAAQDISMEVFGRIGAATIPLILMPAVLILILLVAQKAVVVAPDKLKPKFSRINPVQNAKQKYGPQGLFEFLKSLVKLTAVSVVLGLAIYAEIDRLPGYTRIDPRHLPQLIDAQFWNVMLGVLVLATIIAFLDMSWQRHSHLKRMRMTHQEVKDETKQSDGDPHMRQTRRDRGREIANNRMLHDVPTADVVITNPTHYAVALKWSRKAQTVPVCVAKGEDEMAKRIRLRAEQAGVPVHEDPPTARSLSALVEVGQPIQPEHYKAVAAAIVFADKMRARQREREGG
ncbi:MAG: flagellar type III secretion system protein FlhB [Pseudomonadota bacterium]